MDFDNNSYSKESARDLHGDNASINIQKIITYKQNKNILCQWLVI